MLTETEKRMLEPRADQGFEDATQAPEWAAKRIVEVRSAILSKRPVPPVSPAQEDQILKRVAERLGREVRKAKDSMPLLTPEQIADADLRRIAARQAEEIRRQSLEE